MRGGIAFCMEVRQCNNEIIICWNDIKQVLFHTFDKFVVKKK